MTSMSLHFMHYDHVIYVVLPAVLKSFEIKTLLSYCFNGAKDMDILEDTTNSFNPRECS